MRDPELEPAGLVKIKLPDCMQFFNCPGKLPKLKHSQLFHSKTAIKKSK